MAVKIPPKTSGQNYFKPETPPLTSGPGHLDQNLSKIHISSDVYGGVLFQ